MIYASDHLLIGVLQENGYLLGMGRDFRPTTWGSSYDYFTSEFSLQCRLIAGSHCSILDRALRLLSLYESVGALLRRDRIPHHVANEALRYRELPFDNKVIIIIHLLDGYWRGHNPSHKSTINPVWLVPHKGSHYYGMCLRRLVDRLSSSKSVRRWSAPIPRVRPIVEFNQRWSTLLASVYQIEDVADDEYPEVSTQDILHWEVRPTARPVLIAGPKEISEEAHQWMKAAEANAYRVRLKTKPKKFAKWPQIPLVTDERYNLLQKAEKRDDLRRTFYTTVGEPVANFRAHLTENVEAENFYPLRKAHLALERWSAEFRENGGEVLSIEPG